MSGGVLHYYWAVFIGNSIKNSVIHTICKALAINGRGFAIFRANIYTAWKY